ATYRQRTHPRHRLHLGERARELSRARLRHARIGTPREGVRHGSHRRRIRPRRWNRPGGPWLAPTAVGRRGRLIALDSRPVLDFRTVPFDSTVAMTLVEEV